MKVYNFNEDEMEEFDLDEAVKKADNNSIKTKKVKKTTDVFPEDDDLDNDINIAKEIVSLILYIFFIFLAVFLIIKFVGQRTVVSGSSMEDTLSDGDNLIVDKLTYNFFDEPDRFDVIIFPYKYEEKTFYIKRVIGLPGETVKIDDMGVIYINGSILQESFGTETILNPGLALDEITLASDEYFVLGDNRNNSTDSRFESVGNIKREDIVGRAWLRIYPFNDFGFVEDLD